MSDSMLQRLTTRLRLMLRGATITAGTDSDPGKLQLLQVQFSAGEIRDGTIRIAEFGITSLPMPGAKAFVAAISGDSNGAVVIGTDDARYRPQGLKPGEVTVYDAFGHSVQLTAEGIVINGGGQNLLITNAPLVIADTPLFKVYGDIQAYGNITDMSTSATPKSMAAMRGVHDTHTHPTGGPNTGVPNQQE